MISTADEQHPILENDASESVAGNTNPLSTNVGFQPVQLIEEKRAIFVVNKAVEILKDKQAWCHCSGFHEYVANCSFRSCPGFSQIDKVKSLSFRRYTHRRTT